jgi:hypothetical protein
MAKADRVHSTPPTNTSAPIHSRLTPRPRVLAPAAAHEGPARPLQVVLRTQEVVDVMSSDE